MANHPAPTATERAITLFRLGDVKGALRLAKDFRLGVTPSERAQLARAYECFIRPDFYRQLGFNPKWEIEQGCAVFLRLWCSQNTNSCSAGVNA